MEDKAVKKAFLIYHDTYEIVSELTDEQAGKLFKAIFDFSINGTDFESEDSVVRVAWKFIKQSLSRDFEKYQKVLISRKNKARVGGIIRSLKSGNRLSMESIEFLSESNIGKEYLRKQGVDEIVIESVWNAIRRIEKHEQCDDINCHKIIYSSTTKILEQEE